MAGTQGIAAEAILKTDVGSQSQGGHGDPSLGPIPCDPIVNACVFRPGERVSGEHAQQMKSRRPFGAHLTGAGCGLITC